MSNRTRVRILRKGDPEPPSDYAQLSAAERIEVVWQLTLEAWAFAGKPVDVRLQRHVVRLVRRER